MNWKLIVKDAAKVPARGKYKDWKQLIADECFNQCIYCSIHESAMGGIRNFHVEHYRPKSIFKDKTNDYFNLFYSCPICNTFKGDDWPNEPKEDHSIPAYPNPSEIDYGTLFEFDMAKGMVLGRNIAAKYLQEKLFLNRPQLIIERRIQTLFRIGFQELSQARKLLSEIKDDQQYRQMSEALLALFEEFTVLKEKLDKISRYRDKDVKR